MRLLPLLAALLLAPVASAADLLPTEVEWGPTHARLVVRAVDGEVVVRAEPPVRVALAHADDAAPTPRTLRASAPWRGMSGVVELVLERDDPTRAVDVVIEDSGTTGVWFEWTAARASPAPAAALAVLALLATARGRSGRGRAGEPA